MKVKFVCDCCDLVFEEADIPQGVEADKLAALTGKLGRDIILENKEGSDLYISSTCDECTRALSIDDGDNIIFYGKPLIH